MTEHVSNIGIQLVRNLHGRLPITIVGEEDRMKLFALRARPSAIWDRTFLPYISAFE